MSLKAELETWSAALKAYDEEDFEKSLDLFSRIGDSSKILTNIGLIYATLGEHEAAVERFIEATSLDGYLAVAYFQCGVSNFLLTRYELALKDFEEALLFLRGNQAINYEQLGLNFKLFSAEVLFNKGLSQVYLNDVEAGLADMRLAAREKSTPEHEVIDDAIADRGDGYTVFSIPVGVLYRPSEKKLTNANAKDYMGKAVLIAAADATDAFTTFTGVTRLQQGVTPTGAYVENAPLERSATSAVLPSNRERAPRSAAPLARSQTTINVSSDARERIAPASAPVSRSNTVLNRGAGPAANKALPKLDTSSSDPGGPRTGPGGPSPVRGLNVKRQPSTPVSAPGGGPTARGAPIAVKNLDENRLTEFYDDYLDSYSAEAAPPVPQLNTRAQSPNAQANLLNAINKDNDNSSPSDARVAAWARTNPSGPPRSAPVSTYAPSSFGGGSTMRRKLTRRGTAKRAQSSYEEEEGYASGGESGYGFDRESTMFELIKIRVKLHYQDDTRGMAIVPDMQFEEFMQRVAAKFNVADGSLNIKFKDEDDGKVSLQDDSDWELAIETARESSKGKPEGKLEMWCTTA